MDMNTPIRAEITLSHHNKERQNIYDADGDFLFHVKNKATAKFIVNAVNQAEEMNLQLMDFQTRGGYEMGQLSLNEPISKLQTRIKRLVGALGQEKKYHLGLCSCSENDRMNRIICSQCERAIEIDQALKEVK